MAQKKIDQTAGNKALWGRAGFLIRRLHQITVASFLAEFQDWGLTPNQWGVLTVVAAAPGMSHTDIAAQCGIDRVNVRDIVFRLEEKGLMTQKRSPEDRRQSCTFITKQGQLLLDTLGPKVRHAHDMVLSPLNPTEKEAFLTLLRRLVADNNGVTRAPTLAQDNQASDDAKTILLPARRPPGRTRRPSDQPAEKARLRARSK